MPKEKNSLAVAGFILSILSLGLYVAAFLCAIEILLFPFMAVILGKAAGIIAMFGIIFSAIGNGKSYKDGVSGAGLSLVGLLLGVLVLTLVLSSVALWVVTANMGVQLLPSIL